jgi:hypothetical protein
LHTDIDPLIAPDLGASVEDIAKANIGVPRYCGQCGILMKFVGKLPRSGEKKQLVVYRCYNCPRIVSDEFNPGA